MFASAEIINESNSGKVKQNVKLVAWQKSNKSNFML
jgi:hypothetical protein